MVADPRRAISGPKLVKPGTNLAVLNSDPGSVAMGPAAGDLVVDQIDLLIGNISSQEAQAPDNPGALGDFTANPRHEYQNFCESPTTYSSTTPVIRHGGTESFTVGALMEI